jgi:hypothetical protein
MNDDQQSVLPLVPMCREQTLPPASNDDSERYKNFPCRYRGCKSEYKDKKFTWQQIADVDYDHFFMLMSRHVPVESRTFKALRHMLLVGDREIAAVCKRDDLPALPTAVGDPEKFKACVCSHRGRMNGKTWGEIIDLDYNYFVWSVANAMGRSTITYKSALQLLSSDDRARVEASEKGQFKTNKRTKQ